MSFGVNSARSSIEVGCEITALFCPAQLPVWMGGGLFDVSDHRIALQADYPRLFARIGQAFRLVGDVYDTGTHFRFPDGDRLRKGATVTSGGGLLVHSGAPVIAGKQVTFSETEMEGVKTQPKEGLIYFGVRLDSPVIGSDMVLVAVTDNAEAPTEFAQLAIKPDGIYVQTIQNVVSIIQISATSPSVGDEFLLWRNTITGAWGVILPNNTDTGDLSGEVNLGGFTGPGLFLLVSDMGGTHTIMLSDTTLTPPVGYSSISLSANISATIGTRAGTNVAAVAVTVAGHALTLAELPQIDLPLYIDGATAGDTGTGNIDRRTEPGSIGTELMDGGNYARLAGQNAEHAHTAAGTATIDPEHVQVLRLVRVA